jgi:iron complex outermembrane receptor protein
MIIRHNLRSALASVATASVLLTLALASNLCAQTPEPAASPASPTAGTGIQNEGQLQTVTVTGYVVPRVGEGTQPVTSINSTFIENQGDQTVSDVIQKLPQNVAAFTPTVNAGASFSPGGSSANLYGVGFNSTLTLIDGFRQTLAPFPQNGFQPFVDLNTIPLAAVDRIEVLKDGASSIYGSDAIAGVINVIFKDDYNGADIKYHFGISQRGDYEENHASLTAGISQKLWSDDTKFSVLTTFDYYDSSPIDAIDRPYSSNVNHSLLTPQYSDLQSVRAPAGNFIGLNSGNLYSLIPGTAGPIVTPNNFITNVAFNEYNTVPGVQLIPREQRIGTYDKIVFQPFKFVQIYDDFLYQRQDESANFTATPITNTDGVIVPASNPFVPAAFAAADPAGLEWFGRLLNLGQRKVETIINTYRNVGGIRLINLPNNWYLDASFLYAESDATMTNFNNALNSRLNQALSGTLPGFTGQFLNPFIDTGLNPNQAFINAIRYTANTEARTELVQWAIRGGGDLYYLPSGAITAGAGLEYRSNDFIQINDPQYIAGNITGSGFKQNASGSDYVKSYYGQLILPIFGGQWSWPGMRLLEVDLSGRYDDYSSFGEAYKPKISIRYKPFDDLTLRAAYSESFRAPSVQELFTGPLEAFTFVVDPVTGTQPEVGLVTVGNPNLKPETGYSYYAGAVWSPGSSDPEHSCWGWANGFTAYVDWVQITKHTVIQAIDPQFVVNNPSLFPGFVHRDASGTITTVDDPLENLGSLLVDTIDFGVSYATKEYNWGKLAFELDASWFYYSSQQVVPNGQVFNITDTIVSGTSPTPDFRMVSSLFYSKTVFGNDTFQTGLTLNYIDSEHDGNGSDFRSLGLTIPQLVAESGGQFTQTHVIGYWLTFDWQISYEFGKPAIVTPETPKPGYDKEGKKVVGEKAIAPVPESRTGGIRTWLAGTKLTFGINNIFDTRPPFSDAFTEGFDTSTTSPIQRYFYFEIEKKF